VRFTYGESSEAALKDVSFTIPAAATTALVGASGAGKTTIVNLLLRLYCPDRGRIVVDGVALAKLRRSDWLRLLAVAGQDIDLIEGTVEDNVRMARRGASAEEVATAARIAGAMEIIESLPEGYENWIGQQGMNLSGGQRQRIALARAVLCDPQFLILDEAMSNLDRPLEETIHSAVSERFAGRTVLLITHRLETALAADHIVCLHSGEVVQEGAPSALMADPSGLLSRMLNQKAPGNVVKNTPLARLPPSLSDDRIGSPPSEGWAHTRLTALGISFSVILFRAPRLNTCDCDWRIGYMGYRTPVAGPGRNSLSYFHDSLYHRICGGSERGCDPPTIDHPATSLGPRWVIATRPSAIFFSKTERRSDQKRLAAAWRHRELLEPNPETNITPRRRKT
jgi:ABC-type multidrug transport system ATPase subunit